jgi:hydrogenase-4 membrane subunit HyfE
MLVELAIATDGLIIVFIMGVLVRAVQKQIGTTAIGELASLKEGAVEPAADEVTL